MKKLLIYLLFFSFSFLASPAATFAQSSQTATLSLDPSSGTFNPGCNFSLNVKLDTGEVQTDGTDAILRYDTSRLTATTINNGTIYPDYPGNNIDSSAGKITISGLASVSTPFLGKGTLATINFTVVPTASTGVTQITFEFDPRDKGNTKDSNVVQRGTVVDVLNSVVNGSYVIGSAGNCTSISTSGSAPVVILPGTGGQGQGAVSSPSSQQQVIYKTLPPAGSEQFTFTLAIVGSLLAVLGVLGLALL